MTDKIPWAWGFAPPKLRSLRLLRRVSALARTAN